MTTSTGASIFTNRFFYLECTSLSLIVFGFRKATLGDNVECYEAWMVLEHVYGRSSQDFLQLIECWMGNKCYTIINFFVLNLKRNSSL